MDLRTAFPRSMKTRLAGYVHLARMIDKCRAVLAGTEGEYIYPCPMDERLLDYAGITAEQLARRERAGLWADRDPAYPGDYRRKGGDHVRG